MTRDHARRAGGFTLLEVLVALVVFAVSAAAIMRQTHQDATQQLALEQRSTALWLAEDRLAALAATGTQAALGRSVEEVTVREARWRVTTEVVATPMAQLRRIEVTVAPAPDDSAAVSVEQSGFALVRLATFQGES